MAIKICSADTAFSKCVRERAGWRCERCGAQHEEKSMGLHCAHNHSRGHWGVRFDPANAAALCYGCHSFIDRNPSEKIAWFESWTIQHYGPAMVEILVEKANNTKHGLKKLKKEIAKHYREQQKALGIARMMGAMGWIDFDGFV